MGWALERGLVSASPRSQIERRSTPTKKVFCPLLVVVGAGDLPHQFGRRDVLEFAWGDTLAQRLQRVLNRLYRSRERGMGL
jgi:hypothetical protein